MWAGVVINGELLLTVNLMRLERHGKVVVLCIKTGAVTDPVMPDNTHKHTHLYNKEACTVLENEV